jgi:hypothetical protein
MFLQLLLAMVVLALRQVLLLLAIAVGTLASQATEFY